MLSSLSSSTSRYLIVVKKGNFPGTSSSDPRRALAAGTDRPERTASPLAATKMGLACRGGRYRSAGAVAARRPVRFIPAIESIVTRSLAQIAGPPPIPHAWSCSARHPIMSSLALSRTAALGAKSGGEDLPRSKGKTVDGVHKAWVAPSGATVANCCSIPRGRVAGDAMQCGSCRSLSECLAGSATRATCSTQPGRSRKPGFLFCLF